MLHDFGPGEWTARSVVIAMLMVSIAVWALAFIVAGSFL
jgi:hypothetical protein